MSLFFFSGQSSGRANKIKFDTLPSRFFFFHLGVHEASVRADRGGSTWITSKIVVVVFRRSSSAKFYDPFLETRSLEFKVWILRHGLAYFLLQTLQSNTMQTIENSICPIRCDRLLCLPADKQSAHSSLCGAKLSHQQRQNLIIQTNSFFYQDLREMDCLFPGGIRLTSTPFSCF